MCSIFIGKVLHFTVLYLDCIENPTIVQSDTLCVSLFHLPVFWYLCIPPSCVVVFRLNFVLRGVGALDDRGETDVRTARDPGIPIKFTPSTPHCSGAVQIHLNTNTPKYKYVPLHREIPCTGCVWRLIKCRSLLRSVLSAFVRKRALGIPFMIQSEW